jgi:uncharacterized protein
LEAIEPENPNVVALMYGPVALFAVGDNQAQPKREQLMAASAVSQTSDEWAVQTDAAPLRFRTFAAIKDEQYRLYHSV